MLGNFKEVSCCKIPSSLVKFRDFVKEEENTPMVTSDVERDFISSKKKFDVEIGGTYGKDGGIRLPTSMLNDLDDRPKKAGEKEVAFNIFLPADQGIKYSQCKSTKGADATEDKEKQ